MSLLSLAILDLISLFFIIKPTRRTNFTNLFWHETLHVSDNFSVHHQEFYSLYIQQWYMSHRHCTHSIRAGPGWKSIPSWSCSKAVYKHEWHIPLLSVHWINSWWLTDELSETCRVSCQNKFVKLVHLVGFIIKKFVTMHGHMDVKSISLVHLASLVFRLPRYLKCSTFSSCNYGIYWFNVIFTPMCVWKFRMFLKFNISRSVKQLKVPAGKAKEQKAM